MNRHDQLLSEFRKFHSKHPQVWELFQSFAFEKILQGFDHYSSNGIFERIRWETSVPGVDPSEFKVNNNYRAFYARWFMIKYPEHDGFFRLRVQTSQYEEPSIFSPLGPKDFLESKENNS